MRQADERLAADLAARAGALLVEIRAEAEAEGADGEEAGHRGDLRSNELILAGLADARPGDAVLSEESVDDPRRLEAERVWIVDPLDGTREFGQPGRSDWAVHVALWERGPEAVTAAAVALPAEGLVWSSAAPPALRAFDPGGPVRTVVSESRPPQWLGALGEAVPRLRPRALGSAGAKTMAVVRGDADAYVHAGGQYEWDSAAPVGVALAAGLHASRLDGSPLRYNQEDPYLPDLVVCRAEIAGELLDALAGVTGGPDQAAETR